MRLIHFDLAYTSGMSGGDRCTLETVRYLAGQGVDNEVLLPGSAVPNYASLGLDCHPHCRLHPVPSCGGAEGAVDIMQAYMRRVRHALRLIERLERKPDTVLLCHNEFFPNRTPFFRLADRWPEAALIAWVHMLAPDLWRGYNGQYTGSVHLPDPRLIRYRLEQWRYRSRIPKRATLLTNNPLYERQLRQWFPAQRIHVVSRYSGADVPEFNVNKKYDAAWCGRFHAQKGLEDLVNVCARIGRQRPGFRAVIIGSGDRTLERRFKQQIKREKADAHIDWKGFLDGDEKWRVLQSARLFLMPSRFESFGQVNLEAMKCGLPVVAYDLPVYAVFEKGMETVPVDDPEALARCAAELLDNPGALEQKAAEALDYASGFSWEITGRETLDLARSLIRD
ncbi:glycosyltransferase family 4 protein [Kiritimatiella glycovorans]|uniref:Glycosyltransferase KanE n=1 Tax=Kiritimatiella glycovorans TaxID=1307763 RepID=A0A0G3EJR9_9BACT|nr:glycosyltransferase [Kiritimatiella glycovorans]AKJ65035.1 Glycosyltransferase KanE [Kiritimatiella glycovorans]